MKTTEEVYKTLHKVIIEETGLKVGDTVEVFRKAKSYELGWPNSWVSSMDYVVGELCEISKIDFQGVRFKDHSFQYPIYVLEKVKEPAPTFKLSDEYEAVIQEDGSVKVGCQDISFDLLTRIYTAAIDMRDNV